MICNKCGKENNEGSKFCMWCGESLQTTQELNPNTDPTTNVEEKTNNIEVNNNEPRKIIKKTFNASSEISALTLQYNPKKKIPKAKPILE